MSRKKKINRTGKVNPDGLDIQLHIAKIDSQKYVCCSTSSKINQVQEFGKLLGSLYSSKVT
jgi:hypothetical protein